MTALLSALVTAATVLGLWCAASVVSVPIVVLCVRSQARANDRRSRDERRRDWRAASMR